MDLKALLMNRKTRPTPGKDAAKAMGPEPWFRLHSKLVSSGIWASLLPCSQKVLIVLASLLDNRKRTTYAGVERVAKLAGLSTHRTMVAYRQLKDYGLIWRRRKRVGPHWPYQTGLTNPHKWRRPAPKVIELPAGAPPP